MCDVAGGVIVAYPRDSIGRELAEMAIGQIRRRYGAENSISLDEQLHSVPFAVRSGAHPRSAQIETPFIVERYEVEAGSEQAFSDDLKNEYLGVVIDMRQPVEELLDPGRRLAVAPNWRLHPAAVADVIPEPFTIGTHHAAYLHRMGLSTPTINPSTEVTVAILDNGFEDSFWSGAPTPIHIGSGADLIPGDQSTSGHGTLMGAIVSTSAPGATIEPIRMGGSESTDWDAIHGLARAVDFDADVITLSYRQMLSDRKCGTCGLVRQAARSEVFEKMIDWAVHAGDRHRALLVAAGNGGVGVIARPAASPGAIPVTALDSTGQNLASFANWDPSGLLPVIALPGDDVADGTLTNSSYKGTSFATAYAAAMYAEAMMRWSVTDAPTITSWLCSGAGTVSNAAVPVLP